MAMNPVDAVKHISSLAREDYLEVLAEGGPLFAEHGITTPLSEPRGCFLPSVAY
jgi:hypothetical protein